MIYSPPCGLCSSTFLQAHTRFWCFRLSLLNFPVKVLIFFLVRRSNDMGEGYLFAIHFALDGDISGQATSGERPQHLHLDVIQLSP